MAVSQSKLAWLTPNLGSLWISVCFFWLCGSIVAYPINYRLVPSPFRFEIRQYSEICITSSPHHPRTIVRESVVKSVFTLCPVLADTEVRAVVSSICYSPRPIITPVMACRPGASTSNNALLRDHCTVAEVAVWERSSKTQSEVEIYLKQNMLVYLTLSKLYSTSVFILANILRFHREFCILFSLKYLFVSLYDQVSGILKDLVTLSSRVFACLVSSCYRSNSVTQ